ncbi:hypothetical protein F4803DRAFT_567758 [Xylaria telfairii]|nr:hypothetical protein F4803DRAFT_567758 [Xylaria telfairii]
MAHTNQHVGPETANMIVETNNFRQVLEHFDSAGSLTHKETRLEIECQICLSKNLAFVNPENGKSLSETHEQYVILPRCGHAFGHRCLNYWIKSQSNGPRCPTCREFVYCENGHKITFDIHDAQETAACQAEDVKRIRDMLDKPPCQKCNGQKDKSRRGTITWWFGDQRANTRNQNQNRSPPATNIWMGLSGL